MDQGPIQVDMVQRSRVFEAVWALIQGSLRLVRIYQGS